MGACPLAESRIKVKSGCHSVLCGGGSRRRDFRNRVAGQELSEEGEHLHEAAARGSKVTEVHTWKRPRAPGPQEESDVSKALVSTRWVIARRMVDGKKCVEALPQNATRFKKR